MDAVDDPSSPNNISRTLFVAHWNGGSRQGQYSRVIFSASRTERGIVICEKMKRFYKFRSMYIFSLFCFCLR